MPRTPDLTGIETRQRADGPRYRAEVRDGREKVRGPWRKSIAEAKGDRVRLRDRLDAGVPLRPRAGATGPTVREALRAFLRGAERGEVWTKSGRPYAPKTLRGYAQAADDYLVPAFGDVSVHDLQRPVVQALVDRVAAEHSGQTARNAVTPLCALYRYLLPRIDALGDPTHGLELPQGSQPRQHVATPAELAALLDALPARDRAPLALAGLAGLRAGELRALQVGAVLDDAVVVEASWDAVAGRVAAKHRQVGEHREVPIFDALRPVLAHQRASLGEDVAPSALFLPGTGRWGDRIGEGQPFSREAWATRARRAWDDAGLEPLGLHEARHSFASWLVLTGDYDVATIADWLGHRHVSTTLDRYVKPMRRRGVTPDAVRSYLGALAV